jgi:hypothetical protein
VRQEWFAVVDVEQGLSLRTEDVIVGKMNMVQTSGIEANTMKTIQEKIDNIYVHLLNIGRE